MPVNVGMENCPVFEPFQQSEIYAKAAAACGARMRWLELGVGRAMAVERGAVRLVSRGPVWDRMLTTAEQRRAIRRLARWPGLTLVTPEASVAGPGLIPLVTPMHHAVWALRGELRIGMDRRWRNHLSVADRAGHGFDRDGPGALERLLAAEAPQRVQRVYRTLPAAFSRTIPVKALRLWEWRHCGAVAAAMCFIVHGSTASYHLAWAGPAARERAIHQAMLVRAAEALAAEGVSWLDLGSIDTEAAPGLARFKLGTGAMLKRLGSTLLVLP
jgi:hypothetical protein